MPSSSAPQQRCTFCLEAVSSQSQFGGRSLVTTNCTVHSQAHLDCIYENLKSGETGSLSERHCECGPNMSLFRNGKPLLEDAYQKKDLEALNKMGLVSEPTNQHESTFLTVASNCYTERFMTMWRADQEQLSFTLSPKEHRAKLENCLKKHQEALTESLEKVKECYKKAQEHTDLHANFNNIIRKIENNIKSIKDEQDKIKRDEFILSVFGAFNSGKSTTINAIVGMEHLPYRDSAMTALPTLIRHTPGNVHPVLKLGDKTKTFNELLSKLRKEMDTGHDIKDKPLKDNHELLKLKINTELRNVLEAILNPDYEFQSQYQEEDKIQKCLIELNYMFRILKKLSKESNEIKFNIEEFFQPSSIPVVEIEFTALRGVIQDKNCSFSIMDTPGYGESKEDSKKISELIEKLLVKSSTAIAVLDKEYL
ncbi:dynamin family protein [Endozoicomonas sp. SCSIO W0465]|uniref:dynamin family protein n=1 Tax=Endozoicomonas sp. SCSIO W0465 TaxID=2918516 RepID=UPI00207528C8|nr:dynamin family protein [Endozoicomonas sp. SCSIO W0465]USE37967.1 dynamin family protein [Endozoicomonas sp. SCSIO W0465]